MQIDLYMKKSKIIIAFLACSFMAARTSVSGQESRAGVARLTLSPVAAAMTELTFGERGIPLPEKTDGGFVITDFNAKKEIRLSKGRVAKEGGVYKYDAHGGDLRIRAVFAPGENCVEVTGEIESMKPMERAVIVRYMLPIHGDGAVFDNSLGRGVLIKDDAKATGTVYPIAALTRDGWGVALSIPPSFPCCFGITGAKDGLGVEFYLGLTPETRAFPNKAMFKFTISPAQPGWGFRSALARYYERHRDYYKRRNDGGGLWNWNDPAGIGAADAAKAEPAWPLLKVHGLPHTATYKEQLARDDRHDVLTFAYTIVGMRELTNLKERPKTYDAILKTFNAFCDDWAGEDERGPLHRKSVPPLRNLNLPEQIKNSTMFDENGRYRHRVRETVWGANSITFIENPNPHLFADKGADTVGSVTLKMIADWFANDPCDGVHLDSLGAQWPSWINYRADHFPYARHPLTFDKSGRVGLHNMISHYEFMEAARELALKHDRLLFGNGLDLYKRVKMDEHYNGVENGRFFLAALLDMIGREITSDIMSRERLEACRICMGQKLATAILYEWKEQKIIKQQMEQALAFNLFAAPNRFFADKISYLLASDGYARDREFLEWFVKNSRILHAAGWEPLTHAKANSPDIVCERYGSGDAVYFTLLNLGGEAVDCLLKVDMEALGLAHSQGATSYFSEIARGIKITGKETGGAGLVNIRLEPNQTHIVKLTRTW
jgi:hypothetical protein